MFNSSVMILHMEMIILRMCKHLGENKTEMWFSISCCKYIFLKRADMYNYKPNFSLRFTPFCILKS